MSMTTNTHDLKLDPEPFAELLANRMTTNIRKDDRHYETGDTLIFRETQYSAFQMREMNLPLVYTGRAAWRFCSHVQRGYGLQDGHVALSFVLADAVGAAPEKPSNVSAVVARLDDLLRLLDRGVTSPWVVQELEQIRALLALNGVAA